MNKDKWKDIDKQLLDKDINELLKDLPNPFSVQYSIDTTAYLNWRFYPNEDTESHFFRLAEGYFEVAIKLIQYCIENNKCNKADIWIFPILFNIIHGIELYLKGFNSLYPRYKELVEKEELIESKIEGGHNIRQLCDVALNLIKTIKIRN